MHIKSLDKCMLCKFTHKQSIFNASIKVLNNVKENISFFEKLQSQKTEEKNPVK